MRLDPMDKSETGEPLSPGEQRLWRAFLGWSERATGAVAKGLAAAGVSVPEFEILARLDAAPHGRLGQLALGEDLGWSASRLSHQLTRMSTRGLLAREAAGAGRAVEVTLTSQGTDLLRAAQRLHADAVREGFLAGLGEEGRRVLGEVFERG
ncbi:MarR family winged helix-turn-helix transcriptional regulator [Streptomyces sp. NPDC006684]|uniref:MarR family winged helix-turn-helix transcriptional regulator n=1 Tax=Streptomyces sp. NPDC006684 TaxID=3154477 RepID=UPI00345151A2